MTSGKGTIVPNQFIILTKYSGIFQSYGVVICKITNGKTYLDKKFWNYSKTTSKYRNQFLGETTQETQLKIESGQYKLINLNKLK